MKEKRTVVVTHEHIVMALNDLRQNPGVSITQLCALHRALEPYIEGEFGVGLHTIALQNRRGGFSFTPRLPEELALMCGPFSPPYVFEVEIERGNNVDIVDLWRKA